VGKDPGLVYASWGSPANFAKCATLALKATTATGANVDFGNPRKGAASATRGTRILRPAPATFVRPIGSQRPIHWVFCVAIANLIFTVRFAAGTGTIPSAKKMATPQRLHARTSGIATTSTPERAAPRKVSSARIITTVRTATIAKERAKATT